MFWLRFYKAHQSPKRRCNFNVATIETKVRVTDMTVPQATWERILKTTDFCWSRHTVIPGSHLGCDDEIKRKVLNEVAVSTLMDGTS